jgi:hypothetical protein
VLREIAAAGAPLGVFTNCSEARGRVAVGRLRIPNTVVTAERGV